MTFADPEALLLLLLIPLMVLRARRRAAPPAIGFPGAEDLADLRPSLAARLHQGLPWMRAITLGLVIVALARPQWGVEVTRTRREGIAIAMVMDVSSSMSAIDLQQGDRRTSRLEAVKTAFHDFVTGGSEGAKGRDGDAIGMVTFARYADVLLPPTLDHAALVDRLGQVQIIELPLEDGTAVGDAILRGVEMLRKIDIASRVMILLTDGSNNVGEAEPLTAAQIAAAFGIKVYTIGAGTNGTAWFPIQASDGQIEYRQSAVTIDEEALADIARLTGGKYFRATDAEALRAIYSEIDRLEKTRSLIEHQQLRIEAFPWFVGLALALLVIEVALVNTRLRAIP